MNANPPERAAALERSAGDACAIPKTVDQFHTRMVDDPTYAALVPGITNRYCSPSFETATSWPPQDEV